MRNLLKKTASMLLCLSLAMSLAACGGNGGGSGTVNPEAPSSDVSNEEKKVEAPVKGFLDDFCNLEFSNLNDYLLEEEEELHLHKQRFWLSLPCSPTPECGLFFLTN